MTYIQTLHALVHDNAVNGRDRFHGLTSVEIGEYNRALMFGDNDEAFPSDEEWSMVVD